MLLWLALACAPSVPPSPRSTRAPPPLVSPQWPEAGAPLQVLPVRVARNLHRRRVFLMAGHANGRKQGNTGVHGQIEAEVNLETTLRLAEQLSTLDRFEITLGRTAGQRPSYAARLAHAERVGAHVFIELHTDARGELFPWARLPTGGWAYQVTGAPGFTVLYNEGGPLGPQRRELAVVTAQSLSAAGFLPYTGEAYAGLYDPEGTPGVYIDRRGLMMLRRPVMPSIIIETHNAKDFEESLRWREARTHEAFGGAIADALTRFLSDP